MYTYIADKELKKLKQEKLQIPLYIEGGEKNGRLNGIDDGLGTGNVIGHRDGEPVSDTNRQRYGLAVTGVLRTNCRCFD